MKIRWPPATKALSELSWTIMISTALGSRPATFQIGAHEGPDGVLDFGVANQIETLTLLRFGGTKRRQRKQRQAEEGEDAFGQGRHGLHAG